MCIQSTYMRMGTGAALWRAVSEAIALAASKYEEPNDERTSRLEVMKNMDTLYDNVEITQDDYDTCLRLMSVGVNEILERQERFPDSTKAILELFFTLFIPLVREYTKFPDYNHQLVNVVYKFMEEYNEENRPTTG